MTPICLRRRRVAIWLILLLAPVIGVRGQEVAVKTNLLSDAFLNPNIGAEVALTQKLTLEAEGEVNFWNLGHGTRWKHWAVQPELRYWFCNQWDGHFVGLHVHGGQYNIGNINNGIRFLGTDYGKLSDYRFQGWFAGAGVAYGYDWILSRHWNLEAEIGIGWSYTRYNQFRCSTCNKKIKSDKPHNYVGVTRAAVNLVYVF